MLLTWLLTAGIVVVILMTPTLAQNLFAIPAADAARANSLATFMLILGCITYGLAADRFGVRPVLVTGSIGLAMATAVLYIGTRVNVNHFTGLYGIAGFAVGVVGVVPTALVNAFPPAIRFSGISFAYNVAYAISGGLTPLLVTWWLRSEPNAAVYYVAVACAVGAIAAMGLRRRIE
jgi:MFS family permease